MPRENQIYDFNQKPKGFGENGLSNSKEEKEQTGERAECLPKHLRSADKYKDSVSEINRTEKRLHTASSKGYISKSKEKGVPLEMQLSQMKAA